MNRTLSILLSLLATAFVSFGATADEQFLSRVKPLLDSRCVSCHGNEKQKGSLRLDSREATLKGGDTGPAVVPGKPSESLLLQAVMHSKKDLEMPPKEKLTKTDIDVLRAWIENGAPWPVEKRDAQLAHTGDRIGDAWTDPRNPIVKIWAGQRLDLWSLKLIQHPEPPAPKNARWARNAVDRFIVARLEAEGLRPSLEADRRTLARRVYFDLTGLPPTPDEMEKFLADRRPDAYENLVDDLLASPRYGEHAARQWLDVIRYSDSNGFDWDEFRPRAWRFRDYVIRSFNADKPFDQFVREQLAGDELVEGEPKTPAEQEALVATGYLRMGPQDNSAPLFNEGDRARAELMADLVDTTGSAFLGLTLACNRCHDHKYDPLSHADHYRIRAFFEPVKYADDMAIDLAVEQSSIRKHNAALDEELKPFKTDRDELMASVKKRLRAEKKSKLTDEEKTLAALEKEKVPADKKEAFEKLEEKLSVKDDEAKKAFTEDEKKRHKDLTAQIDEREKKRRQFTKGLLMVDSTEKIPVTKVLFQGDHKSPRDSVEPGFISVLDPNPAPLKKPANAKSTGRRLTLAEWIVSPTNPLTARVLANRLWQSHFGAGLVATPNDFGLAGARPTHPELLDWLATELVRQNWSLKKMHRLIVTSATYRQSSAANSKLAHNIDSENTLLWRQNIRRLSAEQLRDSLLSVSGLLRLRPGGAPIWPELPEDILKANPAFLDDNEAKTKGWYPSPKEEQGARAIYLVQKKTVRVPFMETFDLPENSVSCAARVKSTVAPQALTLLNNTLAVDAAEALATRISCEKSPTAQIQKLFALAFQRPPATTELAACEKFLSQRPLVELCRAALNLNEFIYID